MSSSIGKVQKYIVLFLLPALCGSSLFQGKQPHQAAQPEKAGSRVCAAGIRKGKVLRAVQGSQRGTAQAENRKAECCVLFPGGRADAAGEIKECAYDQSEN